MSLVGFACCCAWAGAVLTAATDAPSTKAPSADALSTNAPSSDAARAEIVPEAEAPSYRNDVMAVFAKAGCSAGACHGNKSGKGGLKLSLRGQDPDADYDTFTRDLYARRTNPLDPDASLLLLKATGRVPHEGGQRFTRQSPEYGILRRWIAADAPPDPAATPTLTRLEVTPTERVLTSPVTTLKITATAVFSDGARRDVSRLAVYEQSNDLAAIELDGTVHARRTGESAIIVTYLNRQQVVRLTVVADRPDFEWTGPAPANYIDEQLFGKLRILRVNPSGPCSESDYLRRAYLDLLGVLPTPDQARAYLSDADPHKREKLVERLFDRPEYADVWAMRWSDLLRNEERTIDRKGVVGFHDWIRKCFADNMPLDQFARQLLAGQGSTYANPPANYYRALRDPVTRGEATAQVFLGTRLGCAQCHNHPFDRWTQDDYYGWADVFSRVDYKIIANGRTDKNDSHEFVGEQIVLQKKEGAVKDPRGGAAVGPRLLASDARLAPDADRLQALADWTTAPDNPFFAKAQVNRIWAYLMGRGIVEPVDDFRATNPPTHPALLEAMSADFVAHHYDVRHLIRTIMASRAYALSSEPRGGDGGDEINYAHVAARRLTAEQLLDAEHAVTETPTQFVSYPKGLRAGQLPGVRSGRKEKPTSADAFLVTFGKPPRLISCDCERSNETTLGQAFQLISGPETAALLAAPDNRIGRLLKENRTDQQIIDDLYWAALSRAPTSEESAAMSNHVRAARDRRAGLEDVAWALLNAKEFVLRR